MAGILLSTALLQLLANADDFVIIPAIPKFSLIHLLALIGFIFTLFLEWGILLIKSRRDLIFTTPTLDWTNDLALPHLTIMDELDMELEDEETDNIENIINKKKEKLTMNMVLLIIIFIESFTTGLTFGLQIDLGDIITFYITIISTDWIESVMITTTIMSSSPKRVFNMVLYSAIFHACIIPFGYAFGFMFNFLMNNATLVIVSSASMSFTSGSFICIATIEILAQEVQNSIPPDNSPSPWSKAKQILSKMAFVFMGFIFSITSILFVDLK